MHVLTTSTYPSASVNYVFILFMIIRHLIVSVLTLMKTLLNPRFNNNHFKIVFKQIFRRNFKIILYSMILIVLIPMNAKSEEKNLFTPYRIFFGFKQQVTSFYSSISLSDREFTQSEIQNLPEYSVYVDRTRVPSGLTPICIKNRSDHTNYFLGGIGFDGNACRKKNEKTYGYDAYPEPPGFSFAALEFAPYYLFSRFGINLSLINRKLHVTLVDYPIKDKELDLKLNSTSVTLPLFLTIGDKDLGRDGSLSMRIGAGPNFSYISQFDLESDEIFERKTDTFVGTTFIIDATFYFMTFKLENTIFKLNMAHPDFRNDQIVVNASDSYVGIYYYF